MLPRATDAASHERGTQEAIAEASRLALCVVRDATLRDELEIARAKVVDAVVVALGSTEGCVRAVGSGRAPASRDANYVLSLLSHSPRIGDLMRRSVLGAFRTALALNELAMGGHLEVLEASRTPAQPAPRPRSIEEALVCDASPGQAAITRTLLRVVMKPAPTLLTVQTAKALRDACRTPKARLVVLDVELPGLDAAAFVREQRGNELPSPTIVTGSPAQLEVLRRTLPEDIVQLARPIERQGMTHALQTLGLVSR